jgi:hypothetical protein
MYYTDFTKTEIFTDRQAALISSRKKAKDKFFNSLVDSVVETDDYGNIIYSNVIRLTSDYQDIKKLFLDYENTRELVYEVKISIESIF